MSDSDAKVARLVDEFENYHTFPYEGDPCHHKHLKIDIKKRLQACKVRATKPIVKQITEDLAMLHQLWYDCVLMRWASQEGPRGLFKFECDHNNGSTMIFELICQRNKNLKHFPEKQVYHPLEVRRLCDMRDWHHPNYREDGTWVDGGLRHRCPLAEHYAHKWVGVTRVSISRMQCAYLDTPHPDEPLSDSEEEEDDDTIREWLERLRRHNDRNQE